MALNKNRIVVKVGTSTLTNDIGQNNIREFEKLAEVLSDVQNRGYEIILVTSGAIAIGANKLGLKEKPRDMRMKQACAAVGQSRMMTLYNHFFSEFDKTAAQILLNAEDIQEEVIPIVNENDSVSYTEIESKERLFGDNDMLSAVVAVLCQASKLVIFSDIDGFFDHDPRLYPNAKLISRIDTIDESVAKLAGGAGSRRGTGGMQTKVQAATLATRQGIDTIVANGKHPEKLYDIIEKKPVGTLFAGKRAE